MLLGTRTIVIIFMLITPTDLVLSLPLPLTVSPLTFVSISTSEIINNTSNTSNKIITANMSETTSSDEPAAKRKRVEVDDSITAEAGNTAIDTTATAVTNTDTATSTAAEETKPDEKKIKTNNDGDNATNGFNGVSKINNDSDVKKTSSSIPLLPRDCKVLLLDIEGCTTSISFVHDVLFPFALNNLSSYLDTGITGDDDSIKEQLEAILKALKDDIEKLDKDHPSRKEIDSLFDESSTTDTTATIKDAICKYVKALMNHDVKATGLKSLQGKIWKNGYATKQIKGHVYQDFTPMLSWCKSQNVSINIYSSGSVNAQKLLFAHTNADGDDNGDLCHYFNSHFDITTSGGKKERQSYINIAKDLGIDVSELCFVSDSEDELVAARSAGVGFVVMSVRPGNAPLTDVGKNEFPIIYSLLQLCGSGQ